MGYTGSTIFDDKEDYDYIIGRYKREGLDMFFYDATKNIKLEELSHKEMLYMIEYLKKPKTYSDKAWYKVFNNAIIDKRRLKIKKIKNKINNNKNTL